MGTLGLEHPVEHVKYRIAKSGMDCLFDFLFPQHGVSGQVTVKARRAKLDELPRNCGFAAGDAADDTDCEHGVLGSRKRSARKRGERAKQSSANRSGCE